jgi:hypothetical protein
MWEVLLFSKNSTIEVKNKRVKLKKQACFTLNFTFLL